jgi:hypothetical protein
VLFAPPLQDSVGRTPLHYAASWGHADCINAVLSAHSGPPKPEWGVAYPNDDETRLADVQNMAGFTPLHYAVWVGRKNAIQVRRVLSRMEVCCFSFLCYVLNVRGVHTFCSVEGIAERCIAQYSWQQTES